MTLAPGNVRETKDGFDACVSWTILARSWRPWAQANDSRSTARGSSGCWTRTRARVRRRVASTACRRQVRLSAIPWQKLAGIFGWSTSKTKARLAAGVFGDPDLLKPEPPTWKVPPETVRDLLNKLAQGYQIDQEGLQPPRRERGCPPPGVRAVGDGTPEAPHEPERSISSPPPPRRRKSEARRHNEWRKHVARAAHGSPVGNDLRLATRLCETSGTQPSSRW
jgi:hypothetical protein